MPSNIAPVAEAARFADQLERSLNGGAWHGPALAEALAGLTPSTSGSKSPAGGSRLRPTIGPTRRPTGRAAKSQKVAKMRPGRRRSLTSRRVTAV